jgi:hypothetical protein
MMTGLRASAERVLVRGDGVSILAFVAVILILAALAHALQRRSGVDEALLPEER